jgi:hypothetical protein
MKGKKSKASMLRTLRASHDAAAPEAAARREDARRLRARRRRLMRQAREQEARVEAMSPEERERWMWETAWRAAVSFTPRACPSCGVECPSGRFCGACGAELPVCSVCGFPLREHHNDEKRCGSCLWNVP